MITVIIGELAAQDREGVLLPIRSDLAPLTAGARDVLREAGPKVEERLRQMGSLPIGGAVMTPAGALGASFLIHVVTASEEEGETALSVQRALKNGLRRAVEWELGSLALPPLGTGVGHMDIEESARAMVEILVNHLDEGHAPLDLVIVVASEYEASVFRTLAEEMTRDRFPTRN
jgi:O-acetyl-ADP-ribose deacetylase (regulator of RNase III)